MLAALFAVMLAVPPSASATYSGDGFTLYGDSTRRTLPTYSIKLASTGFNQPTRDLFQNAINQINSQTNTRISLAAEQYSASTQPSRGTIVVYLAPEGQKCGTVTNWDGCGGYHSIESSGGLRFIASSKIYLKAGLFAKSDGFKKSLIAHELGHALGLDHHGSTSVLMHSTVSSTDGGTYKAGDIRGLRYLAQNTPAPGGKVVTAVAAPGMVINVRASSTTASTIVARVPHGTSVRIVCHVLGQQLSGGPYEVTTQIWNRVSTGGYIWDGNLATGSDNPVVPRC